MNIYIADHNEIFRFGLRRHIESLYNSCNITDVDSKEINADSVNWATIDLIILHQTDEKIQLPNFLRKLRLNGFGPKPKTLILSDTLDFFEAKDLFALGVKGFADRGASLADITEAIREILDGKIYLESSLMMEYITQHASVHVEVASQSKKVLSNKELEVATYLMQGFRTNEISKLLNKSATTISTQKSKIYKKLRVNNVVELLNHMDISKKTIGI